MINLFISINIEYVISIQEGSKIEKKEEYISLLNKTNFQIYEKEAFKLRNLATPSLTLDNECSEDYNYEFTGKVIKRVGKASLDDTYVMIASEGYYSFGGPDQNIPSKITWKVVPKNIIDGGIFLGICAFDNSNPPSSCYNDVDISQLIYFTGLSIIYFAPNCYHIDHYLNNMYWTTPRHCLSEFELMNLTFSFSMQYDGKMGSGLAYFYITYDGFEYFNRSNVFVVVDTNIIPNVALTQVYPCLALYVENTSVEIVSTLNYP
jgi:hypothetical protein